MQKFWDSRGLCQIKELVRAAIACRKVFVILSWLQEQTFSIYEASGIVVKVNDRYIVLMYWFLPSIVKRCHIKKNSPMSYNAITNNEVCHQSHLLQ